jgi:serine/threonine protein kinase
MNKSKTFSLKKIIIQMDRWVKNVLNENTSYSFKEALVHKICNISSLFPQTYNVTIENNGTNISIEMEKLHISNPVSVDKTETWLRILQAVALLNYFNIAHRDIKDENIMFRDNGQAVLIDFGLSKVLIGECHTPDVVSIYYRAPELDDSLKEQKYGIEIDSWSLGIWALELFNKKFSLTKFLEAWNSKNYSEYLKRVPEKIRPIVESFLLPVDQRKKTLDWIEIDKQVSLFHCPPDYDIHVPKTLQKWSMGYKAIRWNLDEYGYSDTEKTVIATWMTSQLFMPWPISLKSLCKPYNLNKDDIYKKSLEWFVNFKLS